MTADKGVTGHQPLAAGDEVGAVTIGMSVCGNGFRENLADREGRSGRKLFRRDLCG